MTYSIVARDVVTGEVGVAVQSHWFSVGPIVPWARPGVGAVATQATAEPAYGPRALDLLSQGASAPEALGRLVAADPRRDHRQVALVDARGEVAAHTGECCMAFAGDVQGEGVSCQANLMASETVWGEMLRQFSSTAGSGEPLARRLLWALEAAEAAGGDVRGRQSAAILVMPAEDEPWSAVCDLRVEDHPQPLAEMARLLALDDAYHVAAEADDRVSEGRHDEAARLYLRASELAPEAVELRFWAGLAAAQIGDLEVGLAYVREAIAAHAGWRDLLPRLPADLAPAAPAVLARL